MASTYPGTLDTFQTDHADGVGEVIDALDINNLADGVNKIEAELGTDPAGSGAGSGATVKARLDGEAWQTIALANVASGSWSPTTMKYFKDGSGIVRIQPLLLTWTRVSHDYTSGTTMCTLPAGYRPADTIRIHSMHAGGTVDWLQLTSGGALSNLTTFTATRAMYLMGAWRGDG